MFDNATDPDGLRPFLPATGRTQVVVTTTDRAFTEFGQPVDVAEFSRPESLGYLQARTGLADQAGAAAVARELGDLPLGLAQAAATISRQHLTYPKYLRAACAGYLSRPCWAGFQAGTTRARPPPRC